MFGIILLYPISVDFICINGYSTEQKQNSQELFHDNIRTRLNNVSNIVKKVIPEDISGMTVCKSL